jgi:hypothetical protein
MTGAMRLLPCLVVVVACGKPAPAPAPAPPPALPPGLGAKVELPPPTDDLYRVLESPRKFRHSSVRGDFRIYRTAAGIVTSWNTLLSARFLDGKPLWRHKDQGRAVAISADGNRIVSNNDAGETLILDAKTGAAIGAPIQLGGPDDTKHPHVWISAFAWLPDGQHILALDSKHVYLLHGDATLDHELAIKCKDDCFFTAAAPLSNDEAIITNSSSSLDAQLLRVKLADGSAAAAVDYYGHDPDLARDGSRFVVDSANELAMFDARLRPVWNAPLPGFRGVQLTRSIEEWEEWKPMPKLSPDGKYVAVNDRAGRLWLLDASTGVPAIAYPTTLIDFVEDVMWLDPTTLIAIDNPGHVTRIAGTPARAVWSEMDAPETARWDGP